MEIQKKKWGVGLRGVRLDVNEQLKIFVKIQKKGVRGVGLGVLG